MNLHDERAMIARIRNRETDALASYIELHRSEILGFVRAISGVKLLTVVELDDILQDIAVSTLQSLHSAPLDQFTPMQWIQQMARRRVVDSHRYHFDARQRDAGRQQSIHAPSDYGGEGVGIENLLVASMTSPSAAMSQDNRLSRMQEAIALLSDEQQSIIRLRYVEGLPSKEIAAKLGKTDVAIRVLLSRTAAGKLSPRCKAYALIHSHVCNHSRQQGARPARAFVESYVRTHPLAFSISEFLVSKP